MSYMLKIITYFIFTLAFIGCTSYNDVSHEPTFDNEITDFSSWYDDKQEELLVMRVNIPEVNDYECAPYDNPTGTLRPCTFEDIDNDNDATDDYKPTLHVQMETDDFVSSKEIMNASFKKKGKSTRANEQSSFRIKLDSKENLYRGERTFQLNKHPYDDSRVRNKMAFDLVTTIPNLPSLKTQFVHLYINDESYGLFTHVEAATDEYLANRGWNEKDCLYKAQDFAYFIYDDLAITSSGAPVDEEAFEAIIEPQTCKNHTKLIEMINALNQDMTNAEFEVFFNKYFNRENYITWVAFNFVVGNKDIVSQNFYLYNPEYSEKFYLIPWDFDGAGRPLDKYVKWEFGLGVLWGIPLHKKFLLIDKNRQDLDDKINLLRSQYITPEIIQNYLNDYNSTVEPFILSEPDNRLSYENWKEEYYNRIIEVLDENIVNYKTQLGHPMPFWQGATYQDGTLKLLWERSVDLEGDTIVYDINVSSALTYSIDENGTVVAELANSVLEKIAFEDDTTQNSMSYSKDIAMSAGTYYLQVIAREVDNSAHYAIGFEKDVVETYTIDGKDVSVKYPGVYRFEVQ